MRHAAGMLGKTVDEISQVNEWVWFDWLMQNLKSMVLFLQYNHDKGLLTRCLHVLLCCTCTHVQYFTKLCVHICITCSLRCSTHVHVDSFLQVATDLLVRQKIFSVGQPGKEIQITQ